MHSQVSNIYPKDCTVNDHYYSGLDLNHGYKDKIES